MTTTSVFLAGSFALAAFVAGALTIAEQQRSHPHQTIGAQPSLGEAAARNRLYGFASASSTERDEVENFQMLTGDSGFGPSPADRTP